MALPSLSHPGCSPSDLPAKASDRCDGSCPSGVVLRSTRRTLWRGPRTEHLPDWCEANPGLPAFLPSMNGIFNDISYQVPTMDAPNCEWVTSGKPRGEERHAREMPVLVNRVRTRKRQVHLRGMWTTAKTGALAEHRFDLGRHHRLRHRLDLKVWQVGPTKKAPRRTGRWMRCVAPRGSAVALLQSATSHESAAT